MNARVEKLFIYPIKGMPGVELTSRGLRMDTNAGVIGDRAYAAYRRADATPCGWRPKGQFHVCMNTERMALPCRDLNEAALDANYQISAALAESLLGRQGVPMDRCTLVNPQGQWRLADTDKPCVSFLNLASVRALEQATRLTIDPRRFRMNVWVEGLAPWAELDYVQGFEQGDQYPMQVAHMRLLIDDLCERCKAIEQSPAIGIWDTNLLQMLAEHLQRRGYKGSPHRGVHTVMGWLAIPEENGWIDLGDTVSLGK